ncbi:hypothetical protein NMY3_02916 [Candidatus Nitrosocosmicus oleophilus]|uniref:Uncharacterized protein n=1 Tax=Candidatus Nitrosocosmicus oleophilus TaxID=1353260 RepID=A0A654M0V6_9ARCH|nr:hypothetical protein NMY3_02916 [Candidatus Nitrosocosmicus oleophilus]
MEQLLNKYNIISFSFSLLSRGKKIMDNKLNEAINFTVTILNLKFC